MLDINGVLFNDCISNINGFEVFCELQKLSLVLQL